MLCTALDDVTLRGVEGPVDLLSTSHVDTCVVRSLKASFVYCTHVLLLLRQWHFEREVSSLV